MPVLAIHANSNGGDKPLILSGSKSIHANQAGAPLERCLICISIKCLQSSSFPQIWPDVGREMRRDSIR